MENADRRSGSKLSRTKARDLLAPRRLSQSNFEEICSPYHISGSDRARLLAEINTILKDIGQWMKNNTHKPHRQLRRDMTSAAGHLKKARNLLDVKAKYSLSALGFVAGDIAPMVSAQWLSSKFPADNLSPTALGLGPFVEDDASLQQRNRFIEHRPVQAIAEILKALEAGVAQSLKMQKVLPGSKGGPKSLRARRILIQLLAVKWERLGKKASTSPNSDFVSFVDNIMDAIGWPSDMANDGEAVAAEARKAVKEWRNLTK